MKTNTMNILNGLIPEQLMDGDYRYRIAGPYVRNRLMLRVAQTMETHVAAPFISYLKNVNDRKLDRYHAITFYIKEHDTYVRIVTDRPSGTLVVDIETLTYGPPLNLRKADPWYIRFFATVP